MRRGRSGDPHYIPGALQKPRIVSATATDVVIEAAEAGE